MTECNLAHVFSKAWLVMASSVFVVACASLNESADVEETAPTTNLENPDSKTPRLEASFEWVNVWLDGDSLRAVVRYGGGCGLHEFVLESSGPMLKSLPPKQPLRLVHRSDGDPCRALIEDSLAWGVREYRGTPRGLTVLLLQDWNEPLNYNYP